jgi:hypothetical protein
MSDEEFGAGMNRLEGLIAEVEQVCSRESLPLVRELVRLLLEVHQSGLRELLQALAEATPGGSGELMRVAARRPVVASLLLMHGLHPDAVGGRVERAVREANDAVPGQAVAELSRLDGANAFVRTRGKAAPLSLLRKAVERAVCERAPDATLFVEEEVEADAAPAVRLIPLERLKARTVSSG